MLAHLALAILTSQTATRLTHWREQFEAVLQDPKEYIGYIHVESEELGGAGADALYPIGSASERFILYFKEGDAGGLVEYQRRHGKIATIEWYLPFKPSKRRRTVHGAVNLYLKRLGLEIPPSTRIPASARRQLARSETFAGFRYHPEMGGCAWLLKPNGTTTEAKRSPDRFTITPEEIALLKMRNHR